MAVLGGIGVGHAYGLREHAVDRGVKVIGAAVCTRRDRDGIAALVIGRTSLTALCRTGTIRAVSADIENEEAFREERRAGHARVAVNQDVVDFIVSGAEGNGLMEIAAAVSLS